MEQRKTGHDDVSIPGNQFLKRSNGVDGHDYGYESEYEYYGNDKTVEGGNRFINFPCTTQLPTGISLSLLSS